MFLIDYINDNGYMIAALAHAVSAALWSRKHPLDRTRTIHENGFHHQRFNVSTFIFLLPVAYGRHDQLAQRSCAVLRVMLQYRYWKQKNEGGNVEALVVKTIFVDGARSIKRMLPAPQGRAYRMRKRSNHVTVIVDVIN